MGRIRALRACALALCLVGCATQSLHQQAWLEVRTRHFDISSALGEKKTQQLADDLENFRSGVEYLIDSRLPAPSIRTRVYAFDGRRVIRPFDQRGASGYFLPSLDGGWVVLRTGGGWRYDATIELKLRLARYFFRNREGLDLPLWYEEGFGQFASTLESMTGGIEIGLAKPDFVHLLRNRLHLSVERLIQLQDLTDLTPQERKIFNAESWALVHYLTFKTGSPMRARQRFRKYFDLVERGTPFPTALEESFGKAPSPLKKELSRYVREKEFQSMVVRVPKRRVRTAAPRTLLPADAASRLGWLAIELSRPHTADRYFKLAVESSPENVSAHAGLVATARLEERWDAAETHYARALSIAPRDPLIHLEGGHAALAHANQATTPNDRKRLAHEARERLRKSIQELSTHPTAYTLLASTYLLAGEDPALGLPFVTRAQKLLPASLKIELVRARLELALGDTVHAAYLAREIASRSTSKSLTREALRLVREASGEEPAAL